MIRVAFASAYLLLDEEICLQEDDPRYCLSHEQRSETTEQFMEESSTILSEKLVVRQLLFLGSHEIDLHSLNRASDTSFCQSDTAASK